MAGSDSTTGGMKIRVALCGCGNIAYKHIKAMSAVVGQLEAPPSSPFLVTALIDPNPKNRAKVSQACVSAFGTSVPKQYDSLQQALDDDTNGTLFDTVDVMVPSLNGLHEEVAIQAMKKQKHVILEKPIALNLASAKRIIAAKQNLIPNRVLMLAENAAYWAEVVAAKKAVDEGRIGTLLTARAKFWESCSPLLNEWAVNYADPQSFYNREDEGIIFDAGFHWVRPLRIFMGEVHSVVATAGKSYDKMQGASMMQCETLLRCRRSCVSPAERRQCSKGYWLRLQSATSRSLSCRAPRAKL